MKKIILLLSAVLIMLAVPLLSLMPSVSDRSETQSDIAESDAVTVLLHESNKLKTITMSEYLVGVAACEMEASAPEEALKAQATAARTLLLNRRAENQKNGYDISDDPSRDQGYLDSGARREKWGKSFDAYEKKLKECVDRTAGVVITYGGEPIKAVYHAISSGKTESAENVWGGDYAYLQSVVSDGDSLSKGFQSSVTLSESDFLKKLGSLGIKAESVTLDPEPKVGGSGVVISYNLCGKTLGGSEIRSAFSLRSAAFTIEKQSSGYVITVKGYGHMVGMSQAGAQYMAQQGFSYDEILSHYYIGCDVGK